MNTSIHKKAMALAFLVTVLWSSSWVLIKLGLVGFPPLTFAGLRYFLAFLLLLITIRPNEKNEIRNIGRSDLYQVLGLGVTLYFFTQGAQFLSLKYFPAVLPALVINLSPILILFLAWQILGERVEGRQIFGVMICILGGALYFGSKLKQALPITWHLIIPFVGLLANVGAALLGRSLNRRKAISAKIVTLGSMGFGSLLLLLAGIILEPWPTFGQNELLILVWLVVVNTSLAFLWWNQSLQTLTTIESSIINNSMIVQVAIFAWIFLDEMLNLQEILALAFVVLGILLVQLRRGTSKINAS